MGYLGQIHGRCLITRTNGTVLVVAEGTVLAYSYVIHLRHLSFCEFDMVEGRSEVYSWLKSLSPGLKQSQKSPKKVIGVHCLSILKVTIPTISQCVVSENIHTPTTE